MRKALVALAGACAMWAGSAQAALILEPGETRTIAIPGLTANYEETIKWIDHGADGAVYSVLLQLTYMGICRQPGDPCEIYVTDWANWTSTAGAEPNEYSVDVVWRSSAPPISLTLAFTGISGTTTISAVTAGGIGIPGVPEPTTWAMMIAGFGLVGGAMRRRAALSPVPA